MVKTLFAVPAVLVLMLSFAPYSESAAPLPATATSTPVLQDLPLLPTAHPFTETIASPQQAVASAEPVPAASSVISGAVSVTVQEPSPVATPDIPSKLKIPKISLEQRVIPVGLTAKGEMDVPSGDTMDVGWYKQGPLPGNTGSAVLDAHVFAAFAKLKHLSVGDDIYVEDRSGQTLHFRVTSVTTYKLTDMGLSVRKFLFNKSDGKFLNLITCAGSLTPDRSTYDHRLVIHAELV